MAEVNPFETWGGMPKLVPQEGQATSPEGAPFGGLQGGPEGSYFQLSPEAMQMMWAPQAQPPLTPQPRQVQLPPLPPV